VIEVDDTVLGNGLPLVSLRMPGTRAVTLLVAFDAGARTERAEENGMAHFLEHLVFKGGERYPTYRDVNETAERLGAQLNAYTSHDVVAFHVTCRAEAVMDAADLLTDFVAKARLDGDELELERGVVIQEINRSDDQPASVAGKLLDRAAYGDHPLGRPVLGPAEHLESFGREAILGFRERRWATGPGGAFVAGDLSSVDPARLSELFERFRHRPERDGVEPAPGFERRILVDGRETNQSHLRLHWRAPIDPRDLRERATLAVYSTLLGGSMGSRLFDEIREQRGLCYAIRATSWAHADAASVEVASGLDSSKCLEAYGRILEIVEELAQEGPTDEEIERARAYAGGSTVLALEGTTAVAARAAAQKVTFGEIVSPEASIAALDEVTPEDVRRVARALTGAPAVACVGPHERADLE
jgi:predicted Zn-dependent peptidase